MKNQSASPATTTEHTVEQHVDSIVAKIDSTCTHNQRLAILKQLRENGPTSILAFRAMGIMAPAPRIFELRAKGYNIDTVAFPETDSAGVSHRGTALYVLKPSVDTEVI